MCLIAHVPEGATIPEDYINSAYSQNSDGIGVMSADGIRKYLGRKALRRAKRYMRWLEKSGVEYAVHFRYATHGAVTLDNCHPHTLPNGNGWLMHNGILCEYIDRATDKLSDTAVFAAEIIDVEARGDNCIDFWSTVANRIARNKLCIMLPDASFILVNSRFGTIRDKIWYSQTYSLPWPRSQHIYVTRSNDNYGSFDERGHWIPNTRAYDGSDSPQWWKEWRNRRDNEDNAAGKISGNTTLHQAPEIVGGPWLAWDRDKHGNDIVESSDSMTATAVISVDTSRNDPAHILLSDDTKLAIPDSGPIGATSEYSNNCVICYVSDIPTDNNGLCQQCALNVLESEMKTEAKNELGALLPGWSETKDS